MHSVHIIHNLPLLRTLIVYFLIWFYFTEFLRASNLHWFSEISWQSQWNSRLAHTTAANMQYRRWEMYSDIVEPNAFVWFILFAVYIRFGATFLLNTSSKCHWIFRILIKVVLQRCWFHVQAARLNDIFLRADAIRVNVILWLFLETHMRVIFYWHS